MTAVNIQELFAPKATDKEYTIKQKLKIATIFRLDSYKFSHPYAYRKDVVGMTSYGTARIKPNETFVAAGGQMFIKDVLSDPITTADVDAAEKFTEAHFGRKLLRRETWDRIVNEYNGLLPVTIRMVPEGTRLKGGLPAYTVTAFGKDFFWLSSAIETMLQRGMWYPSTIATNDMKFYDDLERLYDQTCDDKGLLPFALHDFGGRGVTCSEQAQIGGAAHLFNFMGSDTVEGILAANFYYNSPMAAFSVYATEHSVQCSYGKEPEQQIAYIRQQLKVAKELGLPIISIVLDGYDVYREAEACCTILKEDIIASGVKVVFRPDSGDMMVTVPRILRMQAATFGYTVNSKGFKQIKHVGIIQGDGVDHLSALNLLGKIIAEGYAANNVIFGSGGALLQKVNRDTYKWAQKASSILVEYADGSQEWIGIAKDPITDAGKKSLEGVLTTVRSRMTGELMAADLSRGPLDSEWEDIMQLTYHNGRFFNEDVLDEIRRRIRRHVQS